MSCASAMFGLCLLAINMKSIGKFGKLRPLIFVAFAAWGLVPIIHSIFYAHDTLAKQFIACCILDQAMNGIGALFYISKIPDRRLSFVARRWAFTSHTIFHVIVLVGMIVFHQGARNAFAFDAYAS